MEDSKMHERANSPDAQAAVKLGYDKAIALWIFEGWRKVGLIASGMRIGRAYDFSGNFLTR